MIPFKLPRRRIVNSWRDRLNRSTDAVPALRELRDGYRRWVRLREVRYQYLAAILDDVERFRAGTAQDQLGGDEPSSQAGSSQRIGAPASDTGAQTRRASPHGVCSTVASRSAADSLASAEEVC